MQTLNGMSSEFVAAVSGQGARDRQGDIRRTKEEKHIDMCNGGLKKIPFGLSESNGLKGLESSAQFCLQEAPLLFIDGVEVSLKLQGVRILSYCFSKARLLMKKNI